MVDHDRLAHRLLRAHVAQGTEQVAGLCEVAVFLCSSQTEVGDPEMARAVEQKIRRLDIAVDHTVLMGVVKRLGGLECQAGGGAVVVARLWLADDGLIGRWERIANRSSQPWGVGRSHEPPTSAFGGTSPTRGGGI